MNAKLRKILKNPKLLFFTLGHRGFLKFMPDKKYLEIGYRIKFGKRPNFDAPQTFNEKLQWLKLYNRKNEYTKMVDKYESKKIVADILGENYIIPTLGVWDNFDDVDFDELPDKFVMKCTHDSGGLVICKDKHKLHIGNTRKKINNSLKKNFFWSAREWPYKNVKPRIIAEEYVKDGENEFLPVYKILCFGGEPKIIQTIQNDKQVNESIDYFDTDWNLLDLKQNYPNSTTPLSKPNKLEEMLEIAKRLSAGIPFIRVDLYLVNNEIKFSEYTFYTDSGFAQFEPAKWDNVLGEWLII